MRLRTRRTCTRAAAGRHMATIYVNSNTINMNISDIGDIGDVRAGCNDGVGVCGLFILLMFKLFVIVFIEELDLIHG